MSLVELLSKYSLQDKGKYIHVSILQVCHADFDFPMPWQVYTSCMNVLSRIGPADEEWFI